MRVFFAGLCVSLGLGLVGSGCDDLSAYDGEFKGGIVQGSFVRSCFDAETRLTLSFDPDHAVGGTAADNWISTSDGAFDHTALEPIDKLPDDQLSQLDFPGPRRLRNYLLLARPKAGPLADRDAMVVVSLLESERIELRIIARTADTTTACPAEAEQTDAGASGPEARPREYFGLFRLKMP